MQNPQFRLFLIGICSIIVITSFTYTPLTATAYEGHITFENRSPFQAVVHVGIITVSDANGVLITASMQDSPITITPFSETQVAIDIALNKPDTVILNMDKSTPVTITVSIIYDILSFHDHHLDWTQKSTLGECISLASQLGK